MEDKKPDWTIGDLYSKAFDVVKKNKVLWIFGMALAVGTSSFNYRLPSTLDKFDNNWDKTSPTEQTSQIFSQVLGAKDFTPFNEAIFHIFQSIPPHLYLILILEIIFLILMAIVIGVIYQAWSSASMIESSDKAIHSQKVTIEESSQKAFTRLKPILWLNIIPGLILAVILAALTALLITLFSQKIIIIGVLLSLIALIAFIYISLMLAATSIWAAREAVLNNKSGQDSFKAGYKIAKKKFGAMLLLGLINNIFAGLVIWIPIIIIASLFFAGFTAQNFAEVFKPILFFFGGLFGLIFFLGFILLAGIINAFKAVVWNLAYNAVKNQGKYD